MQGLLGGIWTIALTLGLTVSLPTLPSFLSSQEKQLAQGETPKPAVSAADKMRFRQLTQWAQRQQLHQQPIGRSVQALAEQFLGSSYQASLLDRPAQETLVISLSQFDCLLLVEIVLALARSFSQQTYAVEHFTDQVQALRYRDGRRQGYCSRLHYFSEWVANNQQRGYVQDVTALLGGVVQVKALNFMSQNRTSYPRLASAENYACIQQMETRFETVPITYLPVQQVRQVYDRLHSGDIVAIATDLPGLDVTHTGLVHRSANGRIGLLHASPEGAVVLSADLHRYVEQVPHRIGILVVRPLSPD
jgi:hypothetical protein